MDLFHFVAPSKNSKIAERSKSEDREAPVAPARTLRKTSLPAHLANKKNSSTMPKIGTWSNHYEEKKKSVETLEKLTSRTLLPVAPETLPRKFSRPSLDSPSSSWSGRLPRHPELPPLTIKDEDGPKLKDYLEKPRLVSTGGRKPSKLEEDDQIIPGLAQLTNYYNQTFLNNNDNVNYKNL